MIKELLYKWFGLDDSCKSCETLRAELDHVRREKNILLERLLNPKTDTPVSVNETTELKPIKPQFRYIPHAVRQQMMENEDRKTLDIMQKKQKEIADAKMAQLEKEVLGKEKDDASEISEAV